AVIAWTELGLAQRSRRGRVREPSPGSRLTRHLAALMVALGLALPAAKAEARKHAAPAAAATACTDSDETALWWAPQAPAAGTTIKLLAVGEENGAGELTAIDPAGARHALTVARHPGLPGSVSAELTAAHAGTYRIVWTRGDHTLACRTIDVAS